MERCQPPFKSGVFLRVHSHQRPERTKRSPTPLFHAATREVRQRFREAYALFVDTYRAEAELLRGSDSDVVLPEGSFPPRLPFIPLLEPG